MAKSLIELDGSFGEGGGQILRSSLALSLLTGKPFRLRNVRARRERPGLQPQHLMSVQAAAAVGKAKLTGASLKSTDLTFEPGAVKAGSYRFPILTAGATALVLHTIYLPLALAGGESEITIQGGTHNVAAPSFHFLDLTWRRYLAALGLHVTLAMDRAGFYPRGGGVIRATIRPATHLRGFQGLGEDPVTSVRVISAVAGLPPNIAKRQADRAVDRLADAGIEAEAQQETWPGGPGTMCGVLLPTEPVPTFFFALGERGKPAERVADEAADQAIDFLTVTPHGVDEHSADQLLLPLAFAQEPSRFRVACVSSHLLTNAAVIQRFLPRRIVVAGAEGEPGEVAIE